MPIADRLMVAAELRHKNDVSGVIDFLIDTGADYTTISVDAAQLLGLYDLQLSAGCPPSVRGIGGVVPLRYLPSSTLVFHGPEGQEPAIWQVGNLAVLYVDEAQRRNPTFRGTPSLLGRDFIQHCRLEINREDPMLFFGG